MLGFVPEKNNRALLSSENVLSSILIEIHNLSNSGLLNEGLESSEIGTCFTLDFLFVEFSDSYEITSGVSFEGINRDDLDIF